MGNVYNMTYPKIEDIHTVGTEWVQITTSNNNVSYIKKFKDVYVGMKRESNSILYYSEDGIRWVQSQTVNGYGSDFIIMGDKMYQHPSGANFMLYTEDGKIWRQTNLKKDENIIGFVYVNNTRYICFSSSISVSKDGINWITNAVKPPSTHTYWRFSDFVYFKGIFIAGVAGTKVGESIDSGISYSSDLVNWTTKPNLWSSDSSNDVHLYTDGKEVCLATSYYDADVYQSFNGNDWKHLFYFQMSGVKFFEDVWVAEPTFSGVLAYYSDNKGQKWQLVKENLSGTSKSPRLFPQKINNLFIDTTTGNYGYSAIVEGASCLVKYKNGQVGSWLNLTSQLFYDEHKKTLTSFNSEGMFVSIK